MPDVVVRPCSTEEVSRVLRLCWAYRVPIVPYGGATSLEGHTLAPARGVSLDLNRMNRLLRVSAEDLDATVEAGLGYLDLNEKLAPKGICFPLDPGPGASIGGMCACRCSGSTAVKYGTMRDNVLGVTAVLADGTVIKTGTRARKSAAGYDLTRLLIGSEGTLGVITEVTLRLRRKPARAAAVRVCFPSIRAAAACANATLQAGVEVGRCELMDEDMVRIINEANGFGDPEATTLLYELVGPSEGEVAAQVARVKAVAEKHGGYGLKVSEDEADAVRMWRARKEALWSAGAAYPDRECMITDVCVPLSKLADLIGQTKDEIGQSFLPTPIVAHAGDGNFHAFIMFHPEKVKKGLGVLGFGVWCLVWGDACTYMKSHIHEPTKPHTTQHQTPSTNAAGGGGGGEAAELRDGAQGAGHGRDLHGGARRGPREDQVPGGCVRVVLLC